jgi:DNA-directed RNA polymerase subunit A"
MNKRKLTSEEIEFIVDFVRPNTQIPKETANSIVELTKKRIKKQLETQEVYPEVISDLKKEIERNYIQSIIDPGTSVGILCAQSIGERQTQNSAPFCAEMLIKKAGKILKTTIGEFIESEMKNSEKVFCYDDDNYVKQVSDIEVLTVSQNEKIEWKYVNELSKHPTNGDLVKIKTMSGRDVTTTLSHSHLKKFEDSIVPVLGSELKLGDRIPVIKQISNNNNDSDLDFILVSDYIDGDELELVGEYVYINKTKLKNKIKLDKNFGWFMGAYLSDGNYCTEHSTNIINVNPEFEENIRQFCKIHDIEFKTTKEYGENPGMKKITHHIYSPILSKLILKLCNEGSNKTLPGFVYETDTKFISNLIKGYMDGNSDVFKGKIRSRSSSENLLTELSMLFTYVGIFVKLDYKNGQLLIEGDEYIKKYIREIGTDLFYKKEALNNLIGCVMSSYKEIIPNDVKKHIIRLSSMLNVKMDGLHKNIWRHELGKFIKECKTQSILKRKNIDEPLKYCEMSYNADIVWDEIVEIEIIKECDYNYKYVYDFSVNGNETFALMSGIVVHNTLNSIDWKEQILYSKHDNVIIEPIGKMIDNLLEKFPKEIEHIKENRTEYLQLEDGYYIPSCDEDGYTDWYKIEAITRHLPVGKLVKIKTQSGREVTATQSKSFLIWNNHTFKFEPINGSDIKVGDIVPTTCRLNRLSTQEYFHLDTIFPRDEYLYTDEVVKARNYKLSGETCWWKNHNNIDFVLPYNRSDTLFGKRKDFLMTCEPGYIYMHTSNVLVSHITDKIKLDNDFGFIIGIYLADGWVTKTFMGISKNNENIRKRVTDWCDKYGITYHLVTTVDKYRKGTSNDLKIHSTLLARMFKIICDTGSENKYIPSFAYTAPNDFIRGLMDGYFSGDGSVSKEDGSISCSSVSENLILGVSFLLSYLGIFGRLSSSQAKKNNIGSQNIKKMYNLRISNDFAKTFSKEIYLTENNKQERLLNITMTKLNLYERGKSQEDYPEYLDVYFDEIVSIEYVDGSTEFVYDFTVKTTKIFQLYSGLNCFDTFHRAGQGDKTVTTGVPRFQELLNATKNPKMVNCNIYFNERCETIQELREIVGHNLVCLKLQDLSENIEIKMNKEEEPWYEIFKILYNDNFSKHKDCISIKLKKNILFKYRINIEEIANRIEKEWEDLHCVFSCNEIARIDIFIDMEKIKFTESQLLFVTEENAHEIYIDECVLPILEKLVFFGIPDIKNIYYTNDSKTGEWYIETDGSNFRQLLALPIIDMSRLHSNNVWDIYYNLGIEAAREFLVNEFESIMEGINSCHVKLLVEKMTFNGNISSISRYTLRKDECGPLSKASFEESVEHMVKSGFAGEIEKCIGVSASIICGNRAKMGTGMIDLKININQLKNAMPVFRDKGNDGVVIEKMGKIKLT